MKASTAPAMERKERMKALWKRVADKASERTTWTEIKSEVQEAISEARAKSSGLPSADFLTTIR